MPSPVRTGLRAVSVGTLIAHSGSDRASHSAALIHAQRELDWQRLIEQGIPVTFNFRHSDTGVTSGIRMPLLTWTEGRYLVEGVLALDFGGKIDWKEKDLVLLFHAAQRIATVMGRNNNRPVGPERQAPTAEIGEKCVQRLLNCPKDRFGSARSAVELLQWRHGKECRVILGSEFVAPPPDISWRPIPAADDYDLAGSASSKGNAKDASRARFLCVSARA